MSIFTSRSGRPILLTLLVLAAAWPTWFLQADEAIDLSLNLEPGQSYVLELLIEQTIDQDIPAISQQMTMQ